MRSRPWSRSGSTADTTAFPRTATPASSPPGLLGGQYIGITPGGAEEFLHDGSRIEFVQDAIVLENLISKYLFSQAGKEKAAEPSPQE